MSRSLFQSPYVLLCVAAVVRPNFQIISFDRQETAPRPWTPDPSYGTIGEEQSRRWEMGAWRMEDGSYTRGGPPSSSLRHGTRPLFSNQIQALVSSRP